MTDASLRDSGMEWTILAPDAFAEVWIPIVVAGPVLEGREILHVGSGMRRHSFVSVADVAAFAVAAVDHPSAREAYLPIGGPEAYSYREIVAVFERLLGCPIPQRGVAQGESIPGMPDDVVALLAWEDSFDRVLDTEARARTFGVRLTPLDEIVALMLPVPTPV
jgi:uncharacterized protein YbjT (DUF2867 family)